MRPEILAPAGSVEAFRAAVHAGADAVYLGGDRFGARAYAGNFDQPSLIEAIEYAHLYGVKVYMTVNTLFRNDEIEALAQYLQPFYCAGLDAVIVQDLGAMAYIHQHFPELPIHASTQMTITTPYAYTLLRPYGVTRVVPARELSLQEIRDLKKENPVPEVEVFVQGALCYCYSGQCLMSSMLGGRSGNRGRCAQPCRLPYTCYKKEHEKISGNGAYLLSPKDLCGLEAVPELMKAGVDSFKIEGRMKKPEYVAACVMAYRKIVDAVLDGSYNAETVAKCREFMADVFNRGGFTNGYFTKKNGKDMMSMRHPGNIGVQIGTVEKVSKKDIRIRLERTIHKGDLLWGMRQDSNVLLTSNIDAKASDTVVLHTPGQAHFVKGERIARMQNAHTQQKIHEVIETEPPILLQGVLRLKIGQPAVFEIGLNQNAKQYAATITGEIVQKAQNRPMQQQQVRQKLLQLGNTRYEFASLQVEMDPDVFYPIGALKELRRNAIAQLEKNRIQSFYKDVPDEIQKEHQSVDPADSGNPAPRYPVMVSTMQQLTTAVSFDFVTDLYMDLQFFRKEDIIEALQQTSMPPVWIALPPVIRRNTMKQIQDLLECVTEYDTFAGVVVPNIDTLAYLKYAGYKGGIVADWSLYTMNDYAAGWIRKEFPQAVLTLPVELNRRQAERLSYYGDRTEWFGYGYQRLMISAQCVCRNTIGCNQKNESFFISDRYQKEFRVVCVCRDCYNLIYNSLPTVLFGEETVRKTGCRLHFTVEDAKETRRILQSFAEQETEALVGTKGHFNRGVE